VHKAVNRMEIRLSAHGFECVPCECSELLRGVPSVKR